MLSNTTELNPFNLCESFAKHPTRMCVCVFVCARVFLHVDLCRLARVQRRLQRTACVDFRRSPKTSTDNNIFDSTQTEFETPLVLSLSLSLSLSVSYTAIIYYCTAYKLMPVSKTWLVI